MAPWFKFNPSEWMMGRISRESHEIQALFIQLCCIYWTKKGRVTEADAKLIVGENCWKMLDGKNFVKSSKKFISIVFLDEQIRAMSNISAKRSESGRKGANKKWQLHGKGMANAKQLPGKSMAEEKREDKIRREEKREEESVARPREELSPINLIKRIESYEAFQMGKLRAEKDGIDVGTEALTWAAWLISEGRAEDMTDGRLAAHFLKWMNNAKSRGGRTLNDEGKSTFAKAMETLERNRDLLK